MIPGLTAALRAVVRIRPQQPPPPNAVGLLERFNRGPVVWRLGAAPLAGHQPAHVSKEAA